MHDVLATLMPSTSLSLTARSTVLRVSLVASTGVLRSCTVVVKEARDTLVVKAVREMVAMRRVVISVRKDMLSVVSMQATRQCLLIVVRGAWEARWSRLVNDLKMVFSVMKCSKLGF